MVDVAEWIKPAQGPASVSFDLWDPPAANDPAPQFAVGTRGLFAIPPDANGEVRADAWYGTRIAETRAYLAKDAEAAASLAAGEPAPNCARSADA